MERRRRLIHPHSAAAESEKPQKRPRSPWPALLLASLLLLAGAFALLPAERAEGPWRGWRLLFVPEEIPEERALEVLEAAGLGKIVSESRQTLRLSAWDGKLEDLPLGLVGTRLFPDDPRLDAYVRTLKKWFLASSAERRYRIFYIKDRSAGRFEDNLEAAAKHIAPDCLFLGGERTRAPLLGLLGPGAALFSGTILLLARKKGRLLRIAALLPWLILATGGREALLALVWAGLFTLLVAELEPCILEYWRSGRLFRLGKTLLRGAASSFYLLLPALGSLLASPRLAPAFSLALLSEALLLASFVLLERRRVLRKRRRPFVAVPITGQGGPSRPGANRVLTGAACCAAALGLALSIGGGEGAARASALAGLSAPLPEPISARALPGPGNALALAASRPEEDPPDLADWLVHRARQEALFLDPFGREDPDPFAPISLPMPGGKDKPVLDFSEAWARAAYHSLPETSIEAMLRDQGGYRRASVRPIGSPSSQPLASFDAILYILFLAFPLYGALSGLPRSERAGSVRNSYESP